MAHSIEFTEGYYAAAHNEYFRAVSLMITIFQFETGQCACAKTVDSNVAQDISNRRLCME